MKAKTLYTPVLLLCFNRPKQTKQVFEVIRSVKPQKLYVAVDAPREGREDDYVNCRKVKEIVTNVDWDCETHYLFQKNNLGCSRSGVTAWEWIFSTEDKMIFVEDDGLGSKDAFYFIQDMLDLYEKDTRIAYVGAVNYGLKYGNASYFFSREPVATYFMGTWKRTYNLYDYDLDSYYDVIRTKEFRKNFRTNSEFWLKRRIFDGYRKSVEKNNRYNTYDVQMTYLSYRYNMYSIYPNVNMVSNIGLEGGANNKVSKDSSFYKEYANRTISPLEHIVYVDTFNIDERFEEVFYRKRALYNKPWYLHWFKSVFLQYFGKLYAKYVKPLRWDR